MTDHEAEARPRRFTDQRGIALQTVIIMVVMLAIAGGIAAVLLNRGSEATSQLESQDATVSAYSYGNASLCRSAGNAWTAATALPTAKANAQAADGPREFLVAAGIDSDAKVKANGGYCKP